MRTPQIDEQLEKGSQTRFGLQGLLESMWHSSNEATRITNSEGVIVEINDAYCRFAGMQRKDLIGKPFSIVYDQSLEPTRLVAKYCERFSEKSIEPLMGRPIHFANGKVVFTETSNSFIEGSTGETFLLSIFRDTTERRQLEQALERERGLLRTVINNLPDRIFAKDIESKFILNNEVHLRALGVASQSEATGKTDFDFRASVLAEAMFLDDQEVIQSGKCIVEKEERTVDKSGRSDCFVVTKVPMRDQEGSVIGLVGISRDVTERKALEIREQEHLAALKTSQESLAELNAQKDRLFSILSHDLRSPFTSILGFCEILLDANENVSEADRNAFIGHIQNSAIQQMALLNKLLTWSRLETGRIKFDVKDVDLTSVVAASVSSHLGIAKQKEITLQSTLPPFIKTRGDEVMVTQVFNNLISNALKFTPAHGLISIDLIESKEDQWMLAVKDTGAGIPKEDFKKLFKVEEKYTRVGLAGEEGTGLGLSVVHEILKKHSGSISVQSEAGQGTTFFVQFPRLVEDTEQSVLVVDDDEGVRVLHSRYLKRSFPDSRIIQASNGKEALELAKRYRPRIIVSDYSMPEMNGFEFLTQLRQEPTTREIPVFVITGKDSTASTEAMRLSGAAAVLTKPVSSTQLQAVIEKFMADRI